MKLAMKRLICSAALILLGMPFFNALWASEVNIPDMALKNAIWWALGRSGDVGVLTQEDMLSLTNLSATGLGVEHLAGLEAAENLTYLDVSDNRLSSLNIPGGLTKLTTLKASYNNIRELSLPDYLVTLTHLDLHGNQLTSFALHSTWTNLVSLNLSMNQLASLELPAQLPSLKALLLFGNNLTDSSFLGGLSGLEQLVLAGNQLATLTLPPALVNLLAIDLQFNPLKTFTLPETLATGALAGTVTELRGQGVLVSTYPLTATLTARPWPATGIFECLFRGPPGTYLIEVTSDFSTWSAIGSAINETGSVVVTDPSAPAHAHGFYRAVSPGAQQRVK